MKDKRKTKAQLINELVELRQWVSRLEKSESERLTAENLIRMQRDLALALSAPLSPDEALRLYIETALCVSDMDCGGVYLVDQDSGSLDLAFHTGLPPEFIKEASHYEADSPHKNWF